MPSRSRDSNGFFCPDHVTVKETRPERDTIISLDEIVDLRIDLNTKTSEQFIAEVV